MPWRNLLALLLASFGELMHANAGDAFRAQHLFHSSNAQKSMLENTANEFPHAWFDPAASQSFALVPHSHKVNVTFLDHTMFKGYDGSDFVQLGQYSILTRLCFITETEGHSLTSVDGIIGFGLVEFSRAPSLLLTMSQRERAEWNITQPGKILSPRQFAFLADRNGAELQLGGIDADSYDGQLLYTNMFGSPSYSVKITSVKLGGIPILDFSPTNTTIPGLLDTGTSCITIPSSLMNATFTKVPYDVFTSAEVHTQQAPLVFTIDGNEFELPYSAWYTDGCIEPSKEDLILGDPFFRHFAVLFDMHAKPYRFGIAKRKPDYKFARDLHPDQPYILERMTLQRVQHKTVPTGVVNVNVHADLHSKLTVAAERPMISRVPVTSVGGLQYLVDMAVGTPPQKMRVIFDTGSYMLAVYSREPTKEQKHLAAIGELLSVAETFQPDATADNWMLTPLALVVVAAAVSTLVVTARRTHSRSSLGRSLTPAYTYATFTSEVEL